jgi:organic hydroperoxide reductase OsmC/OhrA
MSEHAIKLHWQRTSDDFDLKTYNRDHAVTFKNNQTVKMSAAVAYRGDADMVDPEEAFVASLASCHMLTFLAIAAGKKLVVDHYGDNAVGYLERIDNGRMAITRVILHPTITFAGQTPDASTLQAMHDKAHTNCFIANSVTTAISIESAT